MVDVPKDADLEQVHMIGRFDAQGRFAWPGTQIATTFDGSTISIDLEDSGKSWIDVTLDGAPQAPTLLAAGRKTYMLASGLPTGHHDIIVTRRTESFFGPTTYRGFSGSPLVPTPKPTRLIEMIGDSITCGYGVLGVGPTACTFSADTEAETHAWGALAAHDLGAAHVSIAYSGFGMYRDYNNKTENTIPALYSRVIADDPTSTWNFAYSPNVIVIGLGTNDFNAGDPGQPYLDAYKAFVQTLRGKFPDAYIVLATSPMESGAKRTQMRAYLDTVAQASADPHVRVVEIAEQLAADGYGCDYHPNEATQRKMATALVTSIRGATGW